MKCFDCPRRCGADREKERGFCGAGEEIRIVRAAPHYGEEPCISGYGGAGTVFFSGCNLRCVFCQNGAISRRAEGRAVTADDLRSIYRELEDEGVHNIELVTASHYARAVAESLEPKPNLPVVWNSGGYDSAETLRLLKGKIDVYMPDLKYVSSALAAKYSFAPDYPSVAKKAIDEMYAQVGDPVFDSDGILVRGVLIRHLILPGQIENTLDVLDCISTRFKPGQILLSLMSQYTPMRDSLPDELSRTVSREEYDKAVDYAFLCGFDDDYIQDFGSDGKEHIPEFNY